jgi:hypothetical protein
MPILLATAACPCFTSMFNTNVIWKCSCYLSLRCSCCMTKLYVHIACLWCMLVHAASMLHVQVVCPCCISLLHTHVACSCNYPCCISCFMLMIYVHISMVPVQMVGSAESQVWRSKLHICNCFQSALPLPVSMSQYCRSAEVQNIVAYAPPLKCRWLWYGFSTGKCTCSWWQYSLSNNDDYM